MSTTVTLPTFAPMSAARPASARKYVGAFVQTTKRIGATRTIVFVCTKLPAFPSPTGELSQKVTIVTKPNLTADGLRAFDSLVSTCIADIQRVNFAVEQGKLTEEAGLTQCLTHISNLWAKIAPVSEYAEVQEPFWAEGTTPPLRTPSTRSTGSVDLTQFTA